MYHSVSVIVKKFDLTAVKFNQLLEKLGYQTKVLNYSKTTRKNYVGWKPTEKAKGLYEKMPFNRMKWKLELIDRINEDQLKDGIPPVIYDPDKLAAVFEKYR